MTAAAADGAGDRAEIDALRARVAELEATGTAPAPRKHRIRALFSAVLIFLAWILAPLAVVAAWSASIVGDTDRYVATVAPLARNPDIQAAIANRATNAIMSELDIQALLQQVAPADRPRLTPLLDKAAGPITGALTSFVHDSTLKVVSSSWFAGFWDDANRAAHASVDKLLTGQGGGAVNVSNGNVTLDLGPLVDRVKSQLAASGVTAAAKVPPVHTSITLMKSTNIPKYQQLFRILQFVGNWLPFVALAFAAGGVLLARNRRRALIVTGLGLFVVAGLVGLGVRFGRGLYLDALPADVSQPAAAAVYDTMSRFLVTTNRTVAVLGLFVAIAAWLSGPSRPAAIIRGFWHVGIDATRGFADRLGMNLGPVGRFVTRYRTWIVWITVVAAAVALLLWSYPTGMVVFWLAFACLVVLGVVEFLVDRPAGSESSVPASSGPPASGPSSSAAS
jgi:hypothetical protein